MWQITAAVVTIEDIDVTADDRSEGLDEQIYSKIRGEDCKTIMYHAPKITDDKDGLHCSY